MFLDLPNTEQIKSDIILYIFRPSLQSQGPMQDFWRGGGSN